MCSVDHARGPLLGVWVGSPQTLRLELGLEWMVRRGAGGGNLVWGLVHETPLVAVVTAGVVTQ